MPKAAVVWCRYARSMLQIARCPIFLSPPAAAERHPCARILGEQSAVENRQVPEPARGDLHAPLLFISSNPSIDACDDSPRESADDATIASYFRSLPECFPRIPTADGETKHVRYWGSVLRWARVLFGRQDVAPGTDFALTEVVHCKSARERGVRTALPICTLLHLKPLLDASNARALVAVGAHAMRTLDVSPGAFLWDVIPGKLVLALPHPGAHLPKNALRGPLHLYTAHQRRSIARLLGT